jgi:predicted nucleic acid-binding Zn ribbon protein
MMVRRRTPRPLREALHKAVEGAEPATTLAAVQRVWAAAVGERVAGAASPVAERDCVVTVACESSSWAQELDLLGGQIADRLRAELPENVALAGLRFTTAGDHR